MIDDNKEFRLGQQFLNKLEGADLVMYGKDGSQFTIDLSTCQLGAVLSILGFRMKDSETYKVFDDKTIATLIMPNLYKLNE